MENKDPKELTVSRKLREKWVKVYTEILEKYPNTKSWLDSKSTNFFQLMAYLSTKRVQELEEYIAEVIEMSESINTKTTDNIDRVKEFIQDCSPRFVTISAVPEFNMPESLYPQLYYATDFKVEEFDPEYHREVLKFYGIDATHNGFMAISMFPAYHTIRNMTREEFDKFLNQKLASTTILTPWDFDEYKEKWIKLYEDTTEPQVKNDKLSKGVRGEYGIIEHYHETKG